MGLLSGACQGLINPMVKLLRIPLSRLPRMGQHPRLCGEGFAEVSKQRLFDLLTTEGCALGAQAVCIGSIYPRRRRPPYLHSVPEA